MLMSVRGGTGGTSVRVSAAPSWLVWWRVISVTNMSFLYSRRSGSVKNTEVHVYNVTTLHSRKWLTVRCIPPWNECLKFHGFLILHNYMYT